MDLLKTIPQKKNESLTINNEKIFINFADNQRGDFFDLSIIIPAKNEYHRIEKTITNLVTTLDNLSIISEIIVVDDGSVDQTPAVANSLGINVITNSENHGIAGAFREGVKHSSGKVVMLCPADIEDFTFLEKAFAASESFEVVSISKRHRDSIVIGYSPWRWFMSNTYQKIVDILFGSLHSCNDTHYIKLYNGELLRSIIGLCRINGPVGETELLLHARDKGCNFFEVPAKIIHKNNNSKTSFTLILRTMSELLTLFVIRKRWKKYENLHYINSSTTS
jgi:dolichol-phosphate mannosyltransferase